MTVGDGPIEETEPTGGAWAQRWSVARIELLDGLRGVRQLVVRALTPIVLFAVVLGVSLATRGADTTRTTPYRVAFSGDPAGSEATRQTLDDFRLAFEPTTDAPLAAARDFDIGVHLPDRLDERIASGEQVSIDVYLTTTSAASRAAVANLRAGLASIYKAQVDEYNADLAERPAATLFTIDRTNVLVTQEGTRELSAQLVPALLVLQAAMLVNATATRILGRNNRGLIMTQLLLPLPRKELARAKAMAELALGLISAAPVLLAVIVYATVTGFQRGGLSVAAIAAGATLVSAVALAVPMVAIGLLIGTVARSQEQVTLGTAVSLVLTATVAAITALGAFPRPAGLAVVPVQGMVSALRDVLNGAGSPVWFLVAVMSTTVFALGVIRLAGRTFNADRMVLRIA